MHVSKKLFTFAVVAILVTLSTTPISARESPKTNLRLVAYAPLESGAQTIDSIVLDLTLAKSMGFDGVKLWDAPGLLKMGILGQVMDEGSRIGLQFSIPIMVGNPAGFPYDQGSIGSTKSYIDSLAAVTRTRNLLSYNVWMPYDFLNPLYAKIVKGSDYRNALENLIEHVQNADPNHRVFAFTDADPHLGFPRDLQVDGYGVQPYSQVMNSLDYQRVVSYLSYFSEIGRLVYVDEWGMHTTNDVSIGRVADQASKARLARQFYGLCYSLDVTCTYFLLLDSTLYTTDWGLLNNDRSLRFGFQL